jgi:L-ascorbate metabolism protein UlaG (beta-lactamase superfamily)
MISAWSGSGEENCAWLTYSANYLMRTGNVRWATDILKNRIASAPAMRARRDLEALAFVLLTHRHADHLTLGLLRELRDFQIRWVIPEAILPAILSGTGLPYSHVIVPKLLERMELNGLRVIPFKGLHDEIPAMGYLVEFMRKRWLFPGDIRKYGSTQLPFLKSVDGYSLTFLLFPMCYVMKVKRHDNLSVDETNTVTRALDIYINSPILMYR